MRRVESAGKRSIGAKRGETPAKRGKTCDRSQVRENVQSVLGAGKHATGTWRGKMRVNLVIIGFVLLLIGQENNMFILVSQMF